MHPSLNTSCFVLIVLGCTDDLRAATVTCHGRDELEAAAAEWLGTPEPDQLRAAVDALIDDGVYASSDDLLLQCHRVASPRATPEEITLLRSCLDLLAWPEQTLPPASPVLELATALGGLDPALDRVRRVAMEYVVATTAGRATSEAAEQAPPHLPLA